MTRVFFAALCVALGAAGAMAAEPAATVAPLQAERTSSAQLGPLQPHWFFAYDTNFLGYLDSKVYLYDGDSGSMLGMLSTGAFGNAVEFAPDFSMIYSPEIYYSRGSRGERTDIVALYDTKDLKAVGEVVIPPKRATGIPHRAYQGISDDGRFVYVANMTPATSVSVVDVVARKFVTEIETSGCNLVYPIGNRAFASLCGDGTVQVVTLDDQGNLKGRAHSEKFFDPDKDPVTEKASRSGNTWLFFSFEGYVHPVDFTGGVAKPAQSLVAVHRRGTDEGLESGRRAVQRDPQRTGAPVRDRPPGRTLWSQGRRQRGVDLRCCNDEEARVAADGRAGHVARGDERRGAAADCRRCGNSGALCL